MQEQYLTILDVVISPFYLAILLLIAKRIRDKQYPPGSVIRRYYIPGLLIKFAGVVFIACIYQFYYGGGDTFNYYRFGKLVNSTLNESFSTWLSLMMRESPGENPYVYRYSTEIEFYSDPSAYFVVRLSALFGLLNFNSYIPSALLFAFISYTGIWAMYKTFVSVYPKLHKELAIAFLFVPSVFVWGSSIFKDTICMFALGWMTYTSFRIFVNRDLRASNFLLLAFSFYLVAIIKVYILLAFLPSIVFWLLLTYSVKIKTAALRLTVLIAVIAILVTGFLFFASQFSAQLNRYSLDRITGTLEETRNWIVYSSGDQGSAYDLGTFDPSLAGILAKFPAAINVTLFRPYLWEVKNPVMLLSAIESFLFLVAFVWVFLRRGPLNFFYEVFKNPNLSFLFIYSLIFAFAVGVSTGNFGALSRYKIPCIPFFAAFLVIMFYKHKTVAPRRVEEPIRIPAKPAFS